MSNSPETTSDVSFNMLVLQEMQLLLSEQRTAFSTLRTGIAIFAFPLSVLSVLIATSKFYEWGNDLDWLLPLLLLNVGLILLGVSLIIHALRRLGHYRRLIEEYKRRHTKLNDLLA